MSRFPPTAGFRSEWEHFDLRMDEGVATVTLNRPDKLNALTFEVYADLRELLGEVGHRPDLGALVIRGEGRGFCSGGDVDEIIGELQQMESRQLLDFTRMTGAVVRALRECPLPVLASIHGVAAGAGSVIALASDFRILSDSARFAFLFTRVGLAGADMGAAYLLPRLVGLGRATELLILGDTIDAETADRFGLATSVVGDDELVVATSELAQRLARGPRWAHATTKSLLTRELDTDLAGAIELEAWAQALLMTSEDHAEFYRAWTEGRDPSWRGK